MSDLLVTDAIAEIRSYQGDDHPSDRGATPVPSLLRFLQREYDQQWGKASRMGVVPPKETPLSISSIVPTDDVPGPIDLPTDVLAIVDVFEYTGGESYRFLARAQQQFGAVPVDQQRGQATSFSVFGQGDGATIQLHPFPGLVSTYYVRYIPRAPRLVTDTPAAGESASIVGLPAECTERIVLGATRRAMQARAQASPQLDRLIFAADEAVGMQLTGRIQGGGPVVRNVDPQRRGWPRRGQNRTYGNINYPYNWIWLA